MGSIKAGSAGLKASSMTERTAARPPGCFLVKFQKTSNFAKFKTASLLIR